MNIYDALWILFVGFSLVFLVISLFAPDLLFSIITSGLAIAFASVAFGVKITQAMKENGGM